MQTFPIDVVGQSYESLSKPLSAQSTLNLFVEVLPSGKTNAACHTWPGKKSFSTGAGPNRGVFHKPWKGNVYMVNGTSLIRVNSSGTRATVGTIAGTARCVFDASSSYLYIVTEGVVYRTDGGSVSTVADSDLETPNSVAHLNQQLIYDGDGGRFVTSDAGDGSSINSLNYATAETYFDDLARVYVFNQTLLLFGTDSIEPLYNSGVGNPPFDRYEGGQRPIGIGGVHAITNTDEAVYFLGSDRTIYRLEGYNPAQVSTPAINNAIEGYATVSDCFAYSLKLQGQSFVVFTFPTVSKTWAYSQETGAWIQLSTGTTGLRDRSNGYCYAFGKHLVSDYNNGNLYELDVNTYKDAGDTYIRERVIRPITSIDVGQPGKRILMSRFELIVETGVGLATGQGSSPVFMMSHSVDGGKTWSNEEQVSVGVQGDYTLKVEYFTFANGYEILVKIRISDPVKCSFVAAAADLEFAGY